MNVQTYLYFNGDCEEALQFYKGALGMTVEFLQRYRDGRPPFTPEGWDDKVFHATVRFGDTLINMSDSATSGNSAFGGFSLLAHMNSEADANRVFAELRCGGEVKMELQTTPWAPRYGVVCDRFGITWKVQA